MYEAKTEIRPSIIIIPIIDDINKFEIINVKKRLKRIFDMSGVSRIIPIQMDEEENNEGIIWQWDEIRIYK